MSCGIYKTNPREEHVAEVNKRLHIEPSSNGDDDSWDEHEVAETEQQRS